jgi:hypothetical protein
MRDYDVRTFLGSLDLAEVRNHFPETRLIHYAALLRHVKWAKYGIELAKQLTPTLQSVIPRVREATARSLRDVMDALFMPDRKQLWRQLTTDDLRAIIYRSTINQLYNLLEDAVESERSDSKQLGKQIAGKLLDVGLSGLFAETGLSDVSMFIHTAIQLDGDLAHKVFSQLTRAGLERIVGNEKKNQKVVAALSHILRDLSVAPNVGRQFLAELLKLSLLPFVRSSPAEGLSYVTYWALMTDVALARELVLLIDEQTWEDKLRDASAEESFWILFNLYQVAPDIALSLLRAEVTHNKVAGTPPGVGLLLLCGIEVEDAPSVLRGLPGIFIEPWVPSKIAMTLRALCHSDLREAALAFRSSLDLGKVEEVVARAMVPAQTKAMFKQVISEFSQLGS